MHVLKYVYSLPPLVHAFMYPIDLVPIVTAGCVVLNHLIEEQGGEKSISTLAQVKILNSVDNGLASRFDSDIWKEEPENIPVTTEWRTKERGKNSRDMRYDSESDLLVSSLSWGVTLLFSDEWESHWRLAEREETQSCNQLKVGREDRTLAPRTLFNSSWASVVERIHYTFPA